MKNLAILGATGSIGESTISVCRNNPNLYKIRLLVAATNVDQMFLLCKEFTPDYAYLSDPIASKKLNLLLKKASIKTDLLMSEAMFHSLLSSNKIDSVMAAIVGSAGLKSTMVAVNAGKEIFLANKEALVISGSLLMDAAKKNGAKLLPVDSEHNAIYQALSPTLQNDLGFCQLSQEGVSSILLTGSGGSFLNRDISTFGSITPEEAVKHPNWSMGAKISVDSSTMMNKGLEYIEAKFLFNTSPKQLKIIIHPQSVIHSMVQYIDGSVIAQMGTADMRIPIAHVMGGISRIQSGAKMFDFFKSENLSFIEPDYKRFPCLKLAMDACYEGQSQTTALNAANEIAVDAFLNKQIKFTQIDQLVERVLNQSQATNVTTIEDLLEIDKKIRSMSLNMIKQGILC